MCACSFSLPSPTSSSLGPLCLCPRLSFLPFLYPSSQKSSSTLQLKLLTLCYWLMCLYLESFQEFWALCQESGAHSCLVFLPLPRCPPVCCHLGLRFVPFLSSHISSGSIPHLHPQAAFLTSLYITFFPPSSSYSCCCSIAKSCLTVTPWTIARQAPLSFCISQSLLKFMSIKSVMLSNHLILYHPLLLLPSIFPSIRVFSNESAFLIRWPKYWSFQLQHHSFQWIFRIDFL